MGKQFHHFTETDPGCVKLDKDFLVPEIDLGREYAFVDFPDIFHQPEATAAMHLGQVEGHMRLPAVGKLDEFAGDLWIVQEGKLVFPDGFLLGEARVLIQVVVRAELMVIQDLIDAAASFATEYLTGQGDLLCVTGIAAMVAKGEDIYIFPGHHR
jgi:hypothetical protein